MNRPAKLDGIDHLNIRVRDPARSSKFYREVFGMKEAFSEMPRAIFLTSGHDLLTLARTKRKPRSGGMHFGFSVRNKLEYDKWKSWLQSKHVKMMSERMEASGGGVYFKDPDGYTIEIFYET
ncbi:MAG TPA: VOC family protein [Nitrososphaerales archaeon]|nr:VOC family protein [Nitrososphaerales archaeon]